MKGVLALLVLVSGTMVQAETYSKVSCTCLTAAEAVIDLGKVTVSSCASGRGATACNNRVWASARTRCEELSKLNADCVAKSSSINRQK